MENIFLDLSNKISSLMKENDMLRKKLSDFGYPETNPIPKADANHWKKKYKDLMELKLKTEYERNRLLECSKSLLKLVQDNKIPFNIKKYPELMNELGMCYSDDNQVFNYDEFFKNKF